MEQSKFRGAYDFLVLRVTAEGGTLQELARWWEQFQYHDESERLALIQQLGKAGIDSPKRRRTYKRKRNVSGNNEHHG
ncbi:poly(A) polymerase I [Alishewanella longhuensis]